mmetsp:Transcript_63111/g.180939  ORF Transcript_63111/g.180939 Transcript_63111/m.180939 type:complete len:223 (-) Transcript_63111:445-1113(-)
MFSLPSSEPLALPAATSSKSSSYMSRIDGRLSLNTPSPKLATRPPGLIAIVGSVTFIGLRFVMSPKILRRWVLGLACNATFSGVSSSSALAWRGTNSGASEDREAPKHFLPPPKGVEDAIGVLDGEKPKLWNSLPKLRLLTSLKRFSLSQEDGVVLFDEPRRIKFTQSSSAGASALGDIAAHAAAQVAQACAAMAACAAKIWAGDGGHGVSQAPGGKYGDFP